MRFHRMTIRRWMFLVAVVALDCAGMLYGSDRLSVVCIVVTAAAPVLIPIAILVQRLGPNVMGR